MVKNISQLTAMWPSTVLFLSQHLEKIIPLEDAYKTPHTNQYIKNGRVRFTIRFFIKFLLKITFTKTREHKTKKIKKLLKSLMSFPRPSPIQLK